MMIYVYNEHALFLINTVLMLLMLLCRLTGQSQAWVLHGKNILGQENFKISRHFQDIKPCKPAEKVPLSHLKIQ